jgi:hypothetical protein
VGLEHWIFWPMQSEGAPLSVDLGQYMQCLLSKEVLDFGHSWFHPFQAWLTLVFWMLLEEVIGSFIFYYEYDYEYEIHHAKRMLYAYAIPY